MKNKIKKIKKKTMMKYRLKKQFCKAMMIIIMDENLKDDYKFLFDDDDNNNEDEDDVNDDGIMKCDRYFTIISLLLNEDSQLLSVIINFKA